mgnify:CR=1 FL=1
MGCRRRHMEQLIIVLRWITAGESHGPALVALVEGMVAGVEVTSSEIAEQLARRRLGYGRGARMKFEADKVTVLDPAQLAAQGYGGLTGVGQGSPRGPRLRRRPAAHRRRSTRTGMPPP